MTTATSEPGCDRCAVLAESSTSFSALESHDDTLFVLDTRGAISALPKASWELRGVVPSGSNAEHFGVTASALAWVGPDPDDPSNASQSRIQVLARDGTAGPQLAAFRGAARLGVGLGAAFSGAFSEDQTGAQILRFSLSTGETSLPAETLSEEEGLELPIPAGSDTEAVWCRTHTDQSSSLWRLGATGDPSKTDYPFSCVDLWTAGDGQVLVLDRASAHSCFYLVDAAGQSQMLTCTDREYDHFVPLSDGSLAFIDGFTAVRRLTLQGQVTLLFSAANLAGIQSDGDWLYYATQAHIGRVAWQDLP